MAFLLFFVPLSSSLHQSVHTQSGLSVRLLMNIRTAGLAAAGGRAPLRVSAVGRSTRRRLGTGGGGEGLGPSRLSQHMGGGSGPRSRLPTTHKSTTPLFEADWLAYEAVVLGVRGPKSTAESPKRAPHRFVPSTRWRRRGTPLSRASSPGTPSATIPLPRSPLLKRLRSSVTTPFKTLVPPARRWTDFHQDNVDHLRPVHLVWNCND